MLPITDPSVTHICSREPMANASVLAGRCTGSTVLEMETEMTGQIDPLAGTVFEGVAPY
jgi:hypothetical protein